MDLDIEYATFESRRKQFSHNPHYDLHSTADEPLAETPPEEAAETPSAPLVQEEGKLCRKLYTFIVCSGMG